MITSLKERMIVLSTLFEAIEEKVIILSNSLTSLMNVLKLFDGATRVTLIYRFWVKKIVNGKYEMLEPFVTNNSSL